MFLEKLTRLHSPNDMRSPFRNLLIVVALAMTACVDQQRGNVLTAPITSPPTSPRKFEYPEDFIAETEHISVEQAAGANYAFIKCPPQIHGLGPFPYDGDQWYTRVGVYKNVLPPNTQNRAVYVNAQDPPGSRITLYSEEGNHKATAASIHTSCIEDLSWGPFEFILTTAETPVDFRRVPNVSHDDCGFMVNDPLYDPYSPEPSPCPSYQGPSGGGSPGGGPSLSCHEEYIVIELSDDGGMTWYVYWEGYAEVCE
jgi:hypothetical protein